MIRRLWACLALAVCVLFGCAVPANAVAMAAATSFIDWSSVVFNPVGNTTITYFDYLGAVQTVANYQRADQVMLDKHDHSAFDTNLQQLYDYSSGMGRAVSLSATVDLPNSKRIDSAANRISHNSGEFFDLATAEKWIYIILEGEGKFHVQGNYYLAANATATDSGEWTFSQAGASLWLYDESSGTWAIRDQTAITRSVSYPMLPDYQSYNGQFNYDVTIPTGKIYRLSFETDAYTHVNSPIPAPEPASALLIVAGVFAVLRSRNPKS